LDEWGFAHVDPRPVGDNREKRRAQRAIRACPRRALTMSPALTMTEAPKPVARPNVAS